MIRLSDYILKFLKCTGVKHIFMLPGGMSMYINDSMGYDKEIQYVCMLHEQACAFAAESYARVTNNLGVVCTTCGPAATNTLTGVAGAWIESTPLLVLTGQVKRSDLTKDVNLRQLGIQEVRIVDMAKPITKYAVCITDPKKIRYELEKAVFIAQEGRKGPVLLDIPVDVQACMIDEDELECFRPHIKTYEIKDVELKTIINKLNTAKRPVIYAGAGINFANAKKDFLRLVEKLNIPVLTHWNAMDLLECTHRLYMGHPGAVGQRAANFVLQNSDLLISIGTRLSLLQTGYNYECFAKNSFHIMVDIDKAELNKKTLHPNLKIHCDAGVFIKKLLACTDLKPNDNMKWILQCKEWNRKYSTLNPKWLDDTNYVNSYYFMDELSKQMSSDDVFCSGRAGTCVDATIQAFNVKKNQEIFVTKGLSAMGNGLPAAIGAAYATGKKIILVNGDGGFVMNIQELEVVRRANLPIKIYILDNQGYSTVRNTQTNLFSHHLVACDCESGLTLGNIKRITEAYNIKTFEINKYSEMSKIIDESLKYEGPSLTMVRIDPDQPIVPRQANYRNPDGQIISRPLEDMKPLLSTKELSEIMSISKE